MTNESGVVIRRLAVSLAAVCLSGCVTLTVEPRAVMSGTGGADGIATLKCDVATRVVRGATIDVGDNALDRQAFRILIWNLHKQDDSGWQRDAWGERHWQRAAGGTRFSASESNGARD